MTRTIHHVLLALVFLSVAWLPGQAEDAAFQYHNPDQINDAVKAIASGNKDLVQLHELGQTPWPCAWHTCATP